MPWDDKLSPDQKGIVLDPARIKVVRAGPGTGKTRLFVAALQKELDDWPHAKAGIAALSYTNVAQQQIAERAGHIPPPHLTTTIDGFILRFIIRPFAHLITQNPQGTRLLPAIIAKHHAQAEVKIGTNVAQRSKLTDIMYIGQDEHGHVQMTGITAYKTTPVHEQQRDFVLAQKHRVWKDHGLLTHTDTHYLAYRIIHHPAHGDAIARLIGQRFPCILVDEYQDTNYFLALTLKKLLAQNGVRGLIVGDTDQAIYEFGGAHPRLFDELEALDGAKTFPLRQTFRCPINVANVATLLAHSHNPVEPTNEQGRSILLAHEGDPTVLYNLLTATLGPGDRIAILARRTDTIDTLKGHDDPEFPGGCKLADQLSSAASMLHTSASKAGQLTSAALAKVLLNTFYPTKTTLEQYRIAPRQWRQAVWHLLTNAATTIAGETWYEWVLRLRTTLATAATMVGITLEPQRITAALRATTAMQVPRQPAPPGAPAPLPQGSILSTVHGVKGDEFELVALYYPKPKAQGIQRCISKQWWNAQETEERRVAFVATTRSMRSFVLCVHNDTYNALRTEQPDFFASFAEHIGPPLATAAPAQAAPRRRTRQTILVPEPIPPPGGLSGP